MGHGAKWIGMTAVGMIMSAAIWLGDPTPRAPVLNPATPATTTDTGGGGEHVHEIVRLGPIITAAGTWNHGTGSIGQHILEGYQQDGCDHVGEDQHTASLSAEDALGIVLNAVFNGSANGQYNVVVSYKIQEWCDPADCANPAPVVPFITKSVGLSVTWSNGQATVATAGDGVGSDTVRQFAPPPGGGALTASYRLFDQPEDSCLYDDCAIYRTTAKIDFLWSVTTATISGTSDCATLCTQIVGCGGH